MKLAILIPTTHDREPLLKRLLKELNRQIDYNSYNRSGHTVVTIVNVDSKEKTTGTKRNELIQVAINSKADAIAFFDDDDMSGETYIRRGIEFMDSGMDCAELWGQIYFNGVAGMPFHHYLGCTHAWQNDKQYHRPPNHLNFMKLDLVKRFQFEDKTFGEDMTWAMEIQNSGAFKTMYPVSEIIYHYYVGFPKNAI